MMSNISPVSQNEGITDNCCDTTVELRKCSFLWTIDQYSTLVKSKYDFKSSAFSAFGDDFKWHLEHKIWIDYNHNMHVELYLKPDFDDLEKYGAVTVNYDISAVRPDNGKDEIKKCYFQFDWDGGQKQCYTGSLSYRDKVQQWMHEDKFKVFCELSYFKKKGDIVNRASSCSSKPVKISESSLSTDFERFFTNDNNFKDVTICVKGKNYPVHKAVLAARSSVFNAMFKSNMKESQKNRIVITDIEQDMFEEMLHYIYTGKAKNLEESAFELLPAADKYDLKELRIMCENVLFEKLSTDNVARILMWQICIMLKT